MFMLMFMFMFMFVIMSLSCCVTPTVHDNVDVHSSNVFHARVNYYD